MFYEWKHSMEADYWLVDHNRDYTFPLHIHACFELLLVVDGTLEVTVGDSTKCMHRGDMAMIFPYQKHSMKNIASSEYYLCVCSPMMINHYNSKIRSLRPTDHFFSISAPYIDLFCSMENNSNICTVKGILYLMCGLFDQTATYYPHASVTSDELLYNILTYVEKNFCGICTLKDLSESLSYDYAYLSKYFMKNIGISFNDFVNQRRLSKACYLLQNTDLTILEISNQCGYRSLRSFNRNFKELIGLSPSEYSKQDLTTSTSIHFSPESASLHFANQHTS